MNSKPQEEFLQKGLAPYPWLGDFCTYIHKERLTRIETYLRFGEIHWVECLASWRYRKDYVRLIEEWGLTGWKEQEGIPDSLLYHLMQVYDHLSGSSRDFVHRFKTWLEGHYRVDSPQLKLPKGRRILNAYRLAFLEYRGDYKNFERTPEMEYQFAIANAVDAEHGFDAPISEQTMCEALEYADEHGLQIELVADGGQEHGADRFGMHYHPEFRKKDF